MRRKQKKEANSTVGKEANEADIQKVSDFFKVRPPRQVVQLVELQPWEIILRWEVHELPSFCVLPPSRWEPGSLTGASLEDTHFASASFYHVRSLSLIRRNRKRS